MTPPPAPPHPTGWIIDSSTFIHIALVSRIPLLVKLRRPLFFPEYVFRFELTNAKHMDSVIAAEKCVNNGSIAVIGLTLEDLVRMVECGEPRSIGLGELACAVIAERKNGGVLSDDHRATSRLRNVVNVLTWNCVEDILIHAAEELLIDEYELDECQTILQRNKYQCRGNLRLEFVSRRLYGNLKQVPEADSEGT